MVLRHWLCCRIDLHLMEHWSLPHKDRLPTGQLSSCTVVNFHASEVNPDIFHVGVMSLVAGMLTFCPASVNIPVIVVGRQCNSPGARHQGRSQCGLRVLVCSALR